MSGVSVLPTLLDRDQNLGDRFLYWEQTGSSFDQAVRWRNWKAVRIGKDKPLALYDLATDPSETKNVASANPSVIDRIEAYLKTARTDSEEWPVEGKLAAGGAN